MIADVPLSEPLRIFRIRYCRSGIRFSSAITGEWSANLPLQDWRRIARHRRNRESSNLRKAELDNIMAEAVSAPGRDIVEEVAAKGRLPGKSHEQKESRYELNQTHSEDRGRAVPGKRGDWLLRHRLCPRQADGIW